MSKDLWRTRCYNIEKLEGQGQELEDSVWEDDRVENKWRTSGETFDAYIQQQAIQRGRVTCREVQPLDQEKDRGADRQEYGKRFEATTIFNCSSSKIRVNDTIGGTIWGIWGKWHRNVKKEPSDSISRLSEDEKTT